MVPISYIQNIFIHYLFLLITVEFYVANSINIYDNLLIFVLIKT